MTVPTPAPEHALHNPLGDAALSLQDTLNKLFGSLPGVQENLPLHEKVARLPTRLPRPPRVDISRAALMSVDPMFEKVQPEAITSWIADNGAKCVAYWNSR